LTDNAGAASDYFASGVTISGDRIVVSVPFLDASVSTSLAGGAGNQFVPTTTDQGAAVFFVNQSVIWISRRNS
jgi:hypothetical protein